MAYIGAFFVDAGLCLIIIGLGAGVIFLLEYFGLVS